MSGESARGLIWTEMRERLARVPVRGMTELALDDLATAAAEFMAGRIGTIARNAQPMIEEGIATAHARGVKEGWEAAADWLEEYWQGSHTAKQIATEMRTRFSGEDDDG